MRNSIENISRIVAISLFSLFLLNPVTAQTSRVYEAEAAMLSGMAETVNCSNASGGQMVKGLDNDAANSLLFQNISLPVPGEYFVIVSYYAVNQRNLTYQINNKDAASVIVPSTGAWCYQGGIPGDHIFKETFAAGENSLLFFNSPIIDKIEIRSDTSARQPSAFFVSSSYGNDDNDGLSPETAWKTLQKANSLILVPGDSLFFKTGDTFTGQLIFKNEHGTSENPILISSYGSINKPVLDGNGYLSTVHIINSSFLHFFDLEITNNGGQPQPGDPTQIRYGMYVENTLSDGTVFKHYRLSYMTFQNIYPTETVTDDDNTGVNAHAITTSGSWGDTLHPARFRDMLIENCFFSGTGRHATVFKSVDTLTIRNNIFEHVGGAGMVIGDNCTNILVEGNTTNYTGSSIDPRMAGRGSGIWCYRTKNLTVQKNNFMHARGIKDSYGMHIDIGNRNVVYQYNYSEDNEGGFVEILGANVNVGYRYNLSVGDGWRTRGTQHGKIFWISGWSGDPQNPVGSDSIFVYNNSVYIRDTIAPGIEFVQVTRNTRFYNNIIYASKDFGTIKIDNNRSFNDFDYNIWYGNIPATDQDGEPYRGPNAITSDPMFKNKIVADSSGFVLREGSPAFGAGKLISNPGRTGPNDYYNNNGGKDFYGNKVSFTSQPNIGAYNGNKISVGNSGFPEKNDFLIFPNPVGINQSLHIKIPDKLKAQEKILKIFDLTGKIRYQKSLENTGNIISGSFDLPPGIYILNLNSGKFSKTKQLVLF